MSRKLGRQPCVITDIAKRCILVNFAVPWAGCFVSLSVDILLIALASSCYWIKFELGYCYIL